MKEVGTFDEMMITKDVLAHKDVEKRAKITCRALNLIKKLRNA